MKLAVFTVTENGTKIANQIKERLKDRVEIFSPPKSRLGTSKPWLMDLVSDNFPKYDGFVFVSAVGIAVRALAPHLKDKTIDPAVVVVDDTGAFSISLLSGHIGGANDLAREVADAVGAMPVITTATDVSGKPAIDIFMKDLGLKIDDKAGLKRVSAGILRGESACIFADIKLGRWGDRAKVAYSVRPLGQLEKYRKVYDHVIVIVSDQNIKTEKGELILKPRRIFAGVGCQKGVTTDEVKQAVKALLAGNGLHGHNLKGLASIDIKSEEAALFKAAEDFNVEVLLYPAEKLDEIAPSKSQFVKEKVGAGGVCEPAAILASRGGKLIATKMVYGRVTVALAEEE